MSFLDPNDEWERMHPYDGTCSKHGHWEGVYDECPGCLEEEERRSQEAESEHLSNMGLCTHCRWGDEDQHCKAPKWNVKGKSNLGDISRNKGPKKHCKYFEEAIYIDTWDD